MSSDKIEKTGHLRWYREAKGTNRVGNHTRRERERERNDEGRKRKQVERGAAQAIGNRERPSSVGHPMNDTSSS